MMSDSDFKLRVRQVVNEVKNRLSTSKDPHELCQQLQRLKCLLPSAQQTPDERSVKGTDLNTKIVLSTENDSNQSNSNEDLPGLTSDTAKLFDVTKLKPDRTGLPPSSNDFSESELSKAQEEFCNHHYIRFLECLVDLMNLEWCGRFDVIQRRDYLDVFFLRGVPQDAFLVLLSAVIQSSPSFKQNKCVSLLEDFLLTHCMVSMVWSQCCITSSDEKGACSSSSVARQKMEWNQLINMMVTLPDRIASKMKDKCRDIFYPKQYFTVLGKEILHVLYKVHLQLKATKDCSLVFASQLIGRICVSGHADILFAVLLPHFAKLTKDDFIWSRICTRLIAGTPERSLESVMHCMVQQIPWYGVMSRLLGDAVLANRQLDYLLTNKFLLHRYYQQDIVPQNIIGYLADSPNRHHLLVKTLKTVLEVWGDGSAVKHTSYDQQLYLTKVILISIGHLTDRERKDNKNDLMLKLMPGVQSHINSPIIKVRRLGMIVAEALTKTVQADGPKLAFEYEKDAESEKLMGLLVPAEDPGIQSLTKNMEEISVDMADTGSVTMDTSNTSDNGKCSQQGEELDSDDDLEPYDMTYDPKVTQVKTPMYIRDCMEGLLSRDNPDLFESSLKVCEQLIRAEPDDLQDVCVEVTKILLHLDNNYDTDNFTALRHNAMISLAVLCPVQVSQYLTTEFYDRNYSIRHRLDVLEVLASAAQELSQPTDNSSSSSATSRRPKELSPLPVDLPGSETWRDIVQKRIESKTRRFAKGSSKPLPKPVANRFASVAGYFFFPLMNRYDSKLNTMDMLGEDFLLLGRMLYTLGVVIHAAQNTTACRQMASSLLEFIWVLRYHTEPFVRQALLFAVSMVILSVPSHMLVSDLQDELLECKLWIEDIVESDPDNECKRLAAQTLVLMQSSVKKELNMASTDNTT
ncbi:telomere length regulation protein TEL2 homolog isoform X2 [Amphiura filiformis]|uniref:telomere length regulation protein TEL2 homolog isoform X2 n=1 Tax=Amphiura filiformis TaxID=82378 RepID=UPI003B223A78